MHSSFMLLVAMAKDAKYAVLLDFLSCIVTLIWWDWTVLFYLARNTWKLNASNKYKYFNLQLIEGEQNQIALTKFRVSSNFNWYVCHFYWPQIGMPEWGIDITWTDPNRPKPNQTDPNYQLAKPTQTKPNWPKPSQTDPNQAFSPRFVLLSLYNFIYSYSSSISVLRIVECQEVLWILKCL